MSPGAGTSILRRGARMPVPGYQSSRYILRPDLARLDNLGTIESESSGHAFKEGDLPD